MNKNHYEYFKKKSTSKYEPLKKISSSTSNLRRPNSLSIENLDSYKNASFEIPGMTISMPIQPSENSGYSTTTYADSADGNSSVDGGRVFLDEYIQPKENELSSLPLTTVGGPQRFQKKSWQSEASLDMDSMDGFKPELYEIKARRTNSAGSLGKIKFSLQYEDKTKRKLILTLRELIDLQFIRGTENVTMLYITAMLIPERVYRFQGKKLERNTNISLDEVFTFHSRPHNRDFEARTIHLSVIYVEKSSKEIVYGESRLPLLSHEIYSQVPTDLMIGIKPSPSSVSFLLLLNTCVFY